MIYISIKYALNCMFIFLKQIPQWLHMDTYVYHVFMQVLFSINCYHYMLY